MASPVGQNNPKDVVVSPMPTCAAISDVAATVSSSVKVGMQFVANSEKLAAICQRVSAELVGAFVDVELSKDLEGDSKAVAELMVAWRDVGDSWSTLAARMTELAASLRKELAEADAERTQRVSEATRLLEALTKSAEAPSEKRKGLLGWLSGASEEPVRNEAVEQARLESQKLATTECLGFLEEQLLVAQKRSSGAVMDAVTEARRHAKAIGDKLMVLKPSWKGSASRETTRRQQTFGGSAGGDGASERPKAGNRNVEALIRSMSTIEGRDKLRESKAAAEEATAVRMRKQTEEVTLTTVPVKQLEANHLQIAGVYDHQVLKVGLRRLDELWPTNDLMEFARGKDGNSALFREPLFRKLLADEFRLASVPVNDVSAAQRDIKVLSLRQLLRLRVIHLDFTPSGCGADTIHAVGGRHEAFMSTLDGLLFQQLGAKAISHLKDFDSSGHVHRLGREAVLLVACAQAVAMTSQWVWWITPERRTFFDACTFAAWDEFPAKSGHGVLEVTDMSRPDRHDPTGRLRWLDWRCAVIKQEIDLSPTPLNGQSASDASAPQAEFGSPPKSAKDEAADGSPDPSVSRASGGATAGMFSPEVLKDLRGSLRKTGGPRSSGSKESPPAESTG